LRARGHRVSFLAPEQHGPWVRAAGLSFTGLPADEAVLHDPDLWHPTRGFGVVWRATRPAMARIVPFVAALPADERCVLLVHPLALPEADLCRAVHPGMKIAAAYLAPANLVTVHDPLLIGPWRVPAWVPLAARRAFWRWVGRRFIDPVALADVNAARAAHGLAPAASLMDWIATVPDLSLTLFPDWFAPTQPDWPQPLVRGDFPLFDPNAGAQLAPDLAAFLRAGPPPLVFTHGTGNTQAAAYFRHARAAATRVRPPRTWAGAPCSSRRTATRCRPTCRTRCCGRTTYRCGHSSRTRPRSSTTAASARWRKRCAPARRSSSCRWRTTSSTTARVWRRSVSARACPSHA
jgi:rhamnosyltransferase subunit B